MFSKQIPQGFVFLPTAALQLLQPAHERRRVKRRQNAPLCSVLLYFYPTFDFSSVFDFVMNSPNSPELRFPKDWPSPTDWELICFYSIWLETNDSISFFFFFYKLTSNRFVELSSHGAFLHSFQGRWVSLWRLERHVEGLGFSKAWSGTNSSLACQRCGLGLGLGLMLTLCSVC